MEDKIKTLVVEKYPMVRLVAHIVGLSDPIGIDHSRRVGSLSLNLARFIKWDDPDDLEILYLSALLHDIGKLAIPESVRLKPGGLMESEWMVIRQHPGWGKDILGMMNSHLSKRVVSAVYAHHENWNGSGYPLGIAGEEIPYEARIIRIADTYDAMTNSRGFRSPITHVDAVNIMEIDQGDGVLFDPEIFRSFLTMMRGNEKV